MQIVICKNSNTSHTKYFHELCMVSIKRIATDHGNIVQILLPYFCLIIACKTIAQRFILKDGEHCSWTDSLHSAGHGFCLSLLLHYRWLDRDNPSATGDWETLRHFHPSVVCPRPVGIQCQTTSGRPYKSTGEGEDFHCRLLLITDIFYHQLSPCTISMQGTALPLTVIQGKG